MTADQASAEIETKVEAARKMAARNFEVSFEGLTPEQARVWVMIGLRLDALRFIGEDRFPGLKVGPFYRLLMQFQELSIKESERLGENEEAGVRRYRDAINLATDFWTAVNPAARQKRIEDRNAEDDNKGEEGVPPSWDGPLCELWEHADPRWVLYANKPGEQAKRTGYGRAADDFVKRSLSGVPGSQHIDVGSLEVVVGRYVQRPWLAYGPFEWVALDALLYANIVECAIEMKDAAPTSEGFSLDSSAKQKGDLQAMRRAAKLHRFLMRAGGWTFDLCLMAGLAALALFLGPPWRYLVILLLAGLLAANATMAIAGLARRVFVPKKRTPWERGLALLDRMIAAYDSLSGRRAAETRVVSPTAVRKTLDGTFRKGNVWPAAAYVVVDYAIKRDPVVWVIQEGFEYSDRWRPEDP